ncbi:MFS transporter [uncultured Cohaesibacter sp.]|uniref:MFS transporter n=1 Tax=uncultured Cohaesibacter sp. TaxID=1002546 RepID=UPI002930A650|nr:MFS transporter [uncultured Cohaesibacter sp.]
MSEQHAINGGLPRLTLRTPRRAVTAMFLLNGALFGIWASRVPAISQSLGLSESLLGILLLSMCAGAVSSFPVAGRVCDRYGSAQVTKSIAFTYGLTLVMLALAPNAILLALALYLFGAAHGAMDVSMNAWAAEVQKKKGKPIMSSFHAMWSLGSGLGAASGFLAIKLQATPTVHFLVAGALILALTLPFAFIPWESPRHKKKEGEKSHIFILPKGVMILVGLLGLCAGIGEGAMGDWSAIFLVQVALVDESHAALGFACFSVTMVAARLAGDMIIAKLGAVKTAKLSGLVVTMGSLLAITAATFPAILIGFAMMGLGYASLVPLIFSRAAMDDQMSPGTAIASVATFGYGGGLIGPVVIGFLADLFSIRWAFVLLSCLAVMIVILAPNLAPPRKASAD